MSPRKGLESQPEDRLSDLPGRSPKTTTPPLSVETDLGLGEQGKTG
jgi:hypothetical protein